MIAWIEDYKGSVLLVRQVVGQRLWTLPGGKVKRNESLKRALKREVREETGLDNAIAYQQMYDLALAIVLLAFVRQRELFPLLAGRVQKIALQARQALKAANVAVATP